MPRLFSNNLDRCRPLIIGDGTSDSGSRIGGTPPAGIIPPGVTSPTYYFATIQINHNPIVEISIFLSFDFDEMADNAGVIHSSDRLVKVVVHGKSIRETDSKFASLLSPHPIIHEPECEDWLTDEEGNRFVRANHKLGGRPYLQSRVQTLSAALEDLKRDGYFQVAQIAFPGAKDGDIGGDWPFADGIFHLLGTESLEKCSWRYFWQY